MTKVLNTTTLYQDKYFSIKCDEIELNNDKIGTFEYADSFGDGAGAVMVVPVDSQGYFYVVSMFQVGTGVETITFPKGGIKSGLTTLVAAQEELQEEIGMKAQQLNELGILYSHPGRAKRKHHIVFAQGLQDSKLLGDEIETITVLKLTQDEIKTMIMNGQICDAKTIASFYMAVEYLPSKNIRNENY